MVAFLINIAGNQMIDTVSKVSAALKIGGISTFAAAGLWASGFNFDLNTLSGAGDLSLGGFLAGVALAVLAYKGFTTITNSGAEVEKPERNIGRAIMISLGICLVVYMLLAVSVAASLTVPEIVAARDYSLAQAARPAFGQAGVYFTLGIATVATVSGLLASIFAVLFDLSRIASLGAIFYLLMDIIVHWGVLRHLREDVDARPAILISAIAMDVVLLGALIVIEVGQDYEIVIVALIATVSMLAFERFYLKHRRDTWSPPDPRGQD